MNEYNRFQNKGTAGNGADLTEVTIMDIKVTNRMGHYEIYVMGNFYCACEDMREVEEELEELKNQAA
ncbi:MAG: hypothetical protein IKH46_06800 [Lachnospiraceae bacterium]|nr:hypothetical protein [Lachnospiraceae bacterium]MBR3735764.1 hypothetical protein [Lachnospiraceae bacterium]MBR6849726.1 hypothetical protein [Lachnospiraceae bacterium]